MIRPEGLFLIEPARVDRCHSADRYNGSVICDCRVRARARRACAV